MKHYPFWQCIRKITFGDNEVYIEIADEELITKVIKRYLGMLTEWGVNMNLIKNFIERYKILRKAKIGIWRALKISYRALIVDKNLKN